ncbi:hypothetical protein GPJ56_007801 [Histomonas meleagridis]|uniref:uncharacterized protein n=1 Tax=Histomonas meleagridis TaxID=135588 RepID=UPI003559DC71|nr:hypothetical protein GPJ56_007801 [Histomonas meleagridis]KAH0798720.1 hypothetical protein GO595_008585 [Histomonas meleagridis]
MEQFKHFYCHCNNVDVRGREVDLHHKTALNYASLRGVLARCKQYPLIQVATSSITIKRWNKISITKISKVKYQLTCHVCSQNMDILPSRNNYYVQFDQNCTSLTPFDNSVPNEIRDLFDLTASSNENSPFNNPISLMNTEHLFTLEPEILISDDDNDDYAIMFGNQHERFVGSFQSSVVYSPFSMNEDNIF